MQAVLPRHSDSGPSHESARVRLWPVIAGLALLLFALALRASTFGDPNLHDDEVFYQTVGIAMHGIDGQPGVLPYVDAWDRKPFGLFALYYLIAFLSHGPLAYQLVATLFAAGTAGIISALARSWSNRSGALMAGALYLAWLETFQGFGGQSPVFYNLFIAAAALIVWRQRTQLRSGRVPAPVYGAMLLAGLAITIKQTAFFEAVFLGLYACAMLRPPAPPRRRLIGIALCLAATGAAPALLISLGYAIDGHWAIYWHAMVTSNFAKPAAPLTGAIRAAITLLLIAPLLVLLALSLTAMKAEPRRFVLCWLGAALLGLLVVPAFHLHYSLPILVPLCAASGGFLQSRITGPIAFAVIAAMALKDSSVLDFQHAARSRAAMARMAEAIRHHDDGPLFVYDGPVQLYPLTGHPFVSPLVFPPHLEHAIEKDVSHLSTLGEVRRVLALRPGTVVTSTQPRENPANAKTLAAVNAYIHTHCRRVETVPTPLWLREDQTEIWTDCRRN